jgi:predicted HAD superfamily Cof-like phosphohydrolase
LSKTNYESVREFHKAFNYPNADKPSAMSMDMVLNRMGFLAEEVIELIHATSENDDEFYIACQELYLRMADSFDKQIKKERHPNKLVGQVDACVDIRYFNSGDFTILGVNPDPCFEEVHSANMRKLFPDGKAHYNEHGKIVKPQGWVGPEEKLEAEIQRQIEAAQ